MFTFFNDGVENFALFFDAHLCLPFSYQNFDLFQHALIAILTYEVFIFFWVYLLLVKPFTLGILNVLKSIPKVTISHFPFLFLRLISEFPTLLVLCSKSMCVTEKLFFLVKFWLICYAVSLFFNANGFWFSTIGFWFVICFALICLIKGVHISRAVLKNEEKTKTKALHV